MTNAAPARGPLRTATFVTGNPGKLAELRRLAGAELLLLHEELDLPEIQSLDLEAVVRAKARAAWERLGRPVLVEETGLELASLNGFPGPLVKWMLAAVGPEGIAAVAERAGEPRARAVCVFLYFDGEREIAGRGTTEGRLVLPTRGKAGFGWDPVFVPTGETRTYAELGDARKDELGHRGRAWRDLVARAQG